MLWFVSDTNAVDNEAVVFMILCRMSAATLATHPLVAASLAGLDSEQTFDAAVDGMLLL